MGSCDVVNYCFCDCAAPTKNACHCEEAQRADVAIPIKGPESSLKRRRLPRHCARRRVSERNRLKGGS